jgi:hypothetical protein
MSYINTSLVAISICATLSGCTIDNDRAGDTKYATDQVLIDEHGLTLKPSRDIYVNFEVISKVYADTMACMGMTATGPTVAYRSFSFAGLGGVWAFYHPVTNTIWINTDEDEVVLERDSRTDIEALSHEFVHHILHKNGAGVQSREHSSPLLKKCGPGVNSYH